MGLKEACGVIGIVSGRGLAANLAVEGLFALQHRGQEAAGVAAYVPVEGGLAMHSFVRPGLVQEVFAQGVPTALQGAQTAIGHVRYSTSGGSAAENAQPLAMDSRFGAVAIAHNGQLTDAETVRQRLLEQGALFRTTSDTEVIVHLMVRSKASDPAVALRAALGRVHGGYALVLLVGGRLLAARDPLGIRPLVLGEVAGEPAVASESAALAAMGGTMIREVAPGEIVTFQAQGPQPAGWADAGSPIRARAFCAFEYVYFSRPDSVYAEGSVGAVRERLGEALAEEWPVETADTVIGVPDSGLPAAVGYARQLNLPIRLGLARNRYAGRTFIRPTTEEREESLLRKLAVVKDAVVGRRVVLVDDSLVRGTTARYFVARVREAGALEVHLRIAAPPYRHPCPYGIDVPTTTELPLADETPAQLGKRLGADSLAFLSIGALRQVIGGQLCTCCFSGQYPTKRAVGSA